MKLIGSRTEEQFREQLVRSRESLFSESGDRRPMDALRSVCPDLRSAYVIGCTPEQAEDIYQVLVDGMTVVSAEIDRLDPTAAPIVEVIPLAEYERGMSRVRRIKIAVALDLARQDLERSE